MILWCWVSVVSLERTLPVVAEKLREAERQLTAYRDVLERAHGVTLKLRTPAVACIGLERLVW